MQEKEVACARWCASERDLPDAMGGFTEHRETWKARCEMEEHDN